VRLRDDVLAAPVRVGAGRRVAPDPPGDPGAPRGRRADRLEPSEPGQRECPGKKGGEETGPNPTDRGKPGSKRHLVVDRNGLPLTVYLTAANVHDSTVFEDLLEGIEPIKRPGPGRPRVRPCKLHADKAYDCRRCRAYLRRRGILSRIARKGIESSTKLGRHRWVVERTIAWLNRCRRLTIRYERNADLHLAFLDLACALIAFNFLRKGFC
jgi:transposase